MVSKCLRKRGSELLSDVKPSAVRLASLSTLSLPGLPSCPAVQWSTSGCLLHPGWFCRKVACQIISLAMLCARLLRLVVKALRAAWLSAPMTMGTLTACSILMSWIASNMPISSALCIVCSPSGPRWKCRVLCALPIHVSTAAVPTFLLITELSKYTLIVSLAIQASSTEASLLSRMLMVKGSLPLFAGLCGLVGIFSTLLMSCLKPLKIVCSGDLCFLMYCLLDAFTRAYNGCLGGIITRWIAALWHHFSNVYEIGGEKGAGV